MATAASTLDHSVFATSYQGLHTSWPCDQFLLNLRTIEKGPGREADSRAALLIHRIGYDCNFKHICQSDSQKVRSSDFAFSYLNMRNYIIYVIVYISMLWLSPYKNIIIYATFYYILTTMQHYKDDTMRSKRPCLRHGQHMKIYN